MEDDVVTSYKQLYDFMPDQCFRMLTCASRGAGKTNLPLYLIMKFLYYDKIYLYAKNLEQKKNKNLIETFQPISNEVGCDVIETSYDKITPVSNLAGDNQKLVIFDDYVCEEKPKGYCRLFHQRQTKIVCSIFQAIMKNRLFVVKIT